MKMRKKILVLIFCMGGFLPCKIFGHDWLCSDSLFFSLLRLDMPGLENVRVDVEERDYSSAKVFLLQYKRLADTGKWFKKPFVAGRVSNETDISADSICMHYICGDINIKRPYVQGQVYMEREFL